MFSSLTLVLSDRCNFSCPYCPQPQGNNELRLADIRRFLDFLEPRLVAEPWIGFSGGEPLLHWPLIEATISHLRRRRQRCRFTLTTNGSLMEARHVRFLRGQRARLVLSYDGLAQAQRDPDSVEAVEAALECLRRLYPGGYVVNSVFTPRTVPLLAASLEGLMRRGHRRLRFSLDQGTPWRPADLKVLKRELGRLRRAEDSWRQKTGRSPLENRGQGGRRGLFACFGGRDRLALLPDRTVWGCEVFHTLLGRDPRHPLYWRYCFGRLQEFIAAQEAERNAVAAHYAELRQDYFVNSADELCALCADLEHCAVCPAAGALATGTLAVLPDWTCRIHRITRAVFSRESREARRPPQGGAGFT